MNASHIHKPSPSPGIEFGQLGVMLELLWRGERAGLRKCNFCKTLNHHGALECEGCAGKLPGAYRDDAATDGPNDGRQESELRTPREWAKMLGWVLAMPLALFIGFAGWYFDYMHERQAMGGSPVSPVAAIVPAPQRLAEQPPLAHQRAGKSIDTAPGTVITETRAGDIVETAALRPLAARDEDDGEMIIEEKDEPSPKVASRVDSPDLAPAPTNRASRASRNNASHAVADPTASCSGQMFLLRAICVDRRCAEPQNARHPHCVAVIKQRKLDEARRNPDLIG